MEKWNAKIARYLNVYRLHIWRERTGELSCLYGWQRTEPLRIWRGLHPIIIIKFGREVRSKLPQLKRETVGVPGEEVLKWDWWSKLKGKAYADLRSGATSKSKRIGDMVLWKAAKTNKLSTNFNPDPFKVVHKTGSEVTLNNKAVVELKRNTAFVKKYKEHDNVSNGNRDQVVQADSTVQADEPGASKSAETTDASLSSEIPGKSEVSENSWVQTRHLKKEGLWSRKACLEVDPHCKTACAL